VWLLNNIKLKLLLKQPFHPITYYSFRTTLLVEPRGIRFYPPLWSGMECNAMQWNGMEWNGMEWNRLFYSTLFLFSPPNGETKQYIGLSNFINKSQNSKRIKVGLS
jgi:hypothetical protein